MRTLRMLFIFALAFQLWACNSAPAGEKAETGEAVETETAAQANATTYVVNTNSSQINWIGSKFTGKKHTGFIKLKEGDLMLKDGKLVGGSFIIDMTSLTDTDLAPGGGKEKLEGHLKDTDFFEVSKYPTGSFTIASVAEVAGQEGATHTITGNLTLKDITKSITIPATITIDNNSFAATTPQFVINRTEWNVMYGSTVLGTAQDNLINDNVALQIELQAAPQQAAN